MEFLNFVNQENAKLALLLNLIEPRCGGVLLAGKKGTGKSTLLKAFKEILRIMQIPAVELPMNATEEAVLGGIDIEETIKSGKRILQKGILSKANKGFLIIEDINLFPHDILSIVFEVQAREENIIEREGITLRESAVFQILATMNPEDAEFSAHFLDRFGMCVIMDEIKEKENRKEIVKLNISDRNPVTEAHQLIKKIQKYKEFIKKVKVLDETRKFISDLVLNEVVSGHRADIFLYYASKAYSAYLEEISVTEEHIKTIAPLVLIHRRRNIESNVEEPEHEHMPEKADNTKEENRDSKEQKNPVLNNQESHYGKSQNVPSSEKEEIFPVGDSYKVKRFNLKKDRVTRKVTGRRTKTKTKGRGGRYIRSLIRQRPEIAIDATLRAAAPFQRIRDRKDTVLIHDDDLRYKEKERKMNNTIIFVVDGSGSMGVEKRMIAVKGAILSLLMDCYQKRDKVSMILFRKDRADVILPPTSSVQLAHKKLRELPTGGKTPLGAGLMEAYRLIRRLKIKEPESRFILLLITDGKSNVALGNKPPIEEVKNICSMLRDFQSTDFIVVDAEKKDRFMKMDLAVKIAEWLQARYYSIDSLKSESLLNIINTHKV